ncbi:MAG TPA: hypothetical protein VMT37_02085 [Solirubrobacterales bacterium]|nr:hypothetical protein [Solirubrobacterales bacterium]
MNDETSKAASPPSPAPPQTTQAIPPTVAGGYEPCEECGAPMDAQQRYCINCAARRPNGANPSSRYFAAMSKKARRPQAGAARKPPPTSRAAAVGFFALLPIAVALGVVVGRSGSGNENNDALLRALRAQENAAVVSTQASNEASEKTAAKAKKNAKGKKKSKGAEKETATKPNAKVHDLTHYHATKKSVEESTKKVEEAPEQVGKNYIKAQQGLPEVIPVGPSTGSSGSGSSGSGAEP